MSQESTDKLVQMNFFILGGFFRVDFPPLIGVGVSQKKLASEAYRAIGGVARNGIANRAL